jgi:hypothetical protein
MSDNDSSSHGYITKVFYVIAILVIPIWLIMKGIIDDQLVAFWLGIACLAIYIGILLIWWRVHK